MTQDPTTQPDAAGQTHDAARIASEALDSAQRSVDALSTDAAAAGAGDLAGANLDLPNFKQVLADVEASGIDLLADVELSVKIELGRTHMFIEDVLRLGEGSVVELDKLAGDPVDVFVNERLVARGEVLVLNESFCVRISEIVADVGAAADQAAEPVEQTA